MPNKNPATDRGHGGPGSSHENADKQTARAQRGDSGGHSNHPPEPGQPTNPDHSQLSGGGGERDKHHTHDPRNKS